MGINIFEAFFVYLYRKRWLLAANFAIACAAGWVLAFVVMEKEYSATVTFLPPAGENLSAMSLLNMSMPSLSTGGASAEQVEVVFHSNSIKRRIIDEFDFITYFKLENSKNPFVLAVKRLRRYVILNANEKGGLGMSRTVSYSITTFHPSPDTARMMADFTFGLVDSSIREISIDRAQRNREFVEGQVATQNARMDSLQAVFQEFQHAHKAYNVPEQARLSLMAYADLRSAALMNELRLSTLRGQFSGNTHEIAELRRNQRVYEQKLKEFESSENPAVIPSLGLASQLMPEYAKMVRDIEVQNQLILFLTRELEQARLQEARDVSPLIIVDPAFVPEYKARPGRLLVILAVVLAEGMLVFGFFAFRFAFKTAAQSGRFSALANAMKKG
jgi:uncharacterized protein involved in exopolysaccharide biosynthesis